MEDQLLNALTQLGAAGVIIFFFIKRDAAREEATIQRLQQTEDWIRNTLIQALDQVKLAIRDCMINHEKELK